MPGNVHSQPVARTAPLRTLATLLRLIRFSHTLFALPWAVAGLFLGARGWPEPRVLFWVLMAMVGARTAAMAFNRLADRDVDATNARTRMRPSVTGEVSPTAMACLSLAGAILFVCASYSLNPLCGHLSWPTLALVLGYSFCKRFTSLSHFILGLSLGLAPIGAYLAARGRFDEQSLAGIALGLAVLAWTAGFDIIYACQDVEHDRRERLHSVPARLGVRGALVVARSSHALVPIFLLWAFQAGSLGTVFLGTVVLVTLLLAYEHSLVRATDLSRVGVAFFNVNVIIAVLVMAGVLLDLLWRTGS